MALKRAVFRQKPASRRHYHSTSVPIAEDSGHSTGRHHFSQDFSYRAGTWPYSRSPMAAPGRCRIADASNYRGHSSAASRPGGGTASHNRSQLSGPPLDLPAPRLEEAEIVGVEEWLDPSAGPPLPLLLCQQQQVTKSLDYSAVATPALPPAEWGPACSRARMGLRPFSSASHSTGARHPHADCEQLNLHIQALLSAGIIRLAKRGPFLSFPFLVPKADVESTSQVDSHGVQPGRRPVAWQTWSVFIVAPLFLFIPCNR